MMINLNKYIGVSIALLTFGCDNTSVNNPKDGSKHSIQKLEYNDTNESNHNAVEANITAVEVSGSKGAYSFSVTVSSVETGCDQYANWWEVLDSEGTLLYRRILLHAHPDAQPFTRVGGDVDIDPYTLVYVRAHMHPVGYVGTVLKGSVATGFRKVENVPEFDKEIEEQEPLSTGCFD